MRRSTRRGLLLFCVLIAALLPAPVCPQSATASLEIRVLGGYGPVAGADVRLTAPGLARRALTDRDGQALFAHLRPGRYRISAAAADAPGLESEVGVAPGLKQSVTLRLSGAPEAPVEVRAHTFDRATVLSDDDLRSPPRPADPWSLLRDVPGIVVDRVDVGGSETAQQSLLVSHGDGGASATWTLDGVDVTDPASLGFTALFPDTAALTAAQVRTSALDVRVRTPGVQVGLHLREPPDRLSGALHVRGTGVALQSDNLPAALRQRRFFRNRTERILEIGGEAGGRVLGERLWLWSAASHNALRQQTFTEHGESLRTTSFTGKGRLRLGDGALSLLAVRSEKVHQGRDTTLSAAPEARWRQSGPAWLFAAEDQRLLGGVSILSRISHLDGGFRLDPPGGTGADAFEDFRGVFRGSYLSFVTERSRLQAGIEATARRRWLGLGHDLVLGLGYRRMPVETRSGWPGGKVLALERRSVFFRAFRLTGFALPTRDQDARSVHDQLEAYVQDGVDIGRFTVTAGLRLDRLSGRNRASSVGANPVFPELLPAVRYGGDPARFRWLDLLPRVGLAWDARGDGRLVARASYAAYGGPLGAADVAFDNPIGREVASLAYFWRDGNGDHVVQADELDRLRGRVVSNGLDPDDPASTASPHSIDAGLRAPRTHEGAASVEQSFGRGLSVGLHASFRRLLHPLWRPLRNLALSDYVIRGAVRGRLFDRDYTVGYFAPASASKIVPGNGRILANREGYHQDAVTAEAVLRGEIGERLAWEAWGAVTDWRERFDDVDRAIQDPTPLDTEPLQDAGHVAVRPGGLGRADVFVNARWTAGAAVRARLPWRLDAAALLHAREGFPIPYFEVAQTGDPTGGAKSVLISPHLTSFRLPALAIVDARLERAFPLGRGTLTAAADAFNLLDRSTALQAARDVELPAFGRPREIVRPRIVRFGLGYRF